MTQDLLTSLEDLREEFVDLLGELDQLSQQAEAMEERVSLGYLLWSLGKQIETRFAPVKAELRKAAPDNLQPGTTKIAGVTDDHHAAVTVPKSKFVLRKGVDIKALKELLGEDFSRLIREKVSYTPLREELEEEFKTASPARKKALLRVLDQVGGTIRISFQE